MLTFLVSKRQFLTKFGGNCCNLCPFLNKKICLGLWNAKASNWSSICWWSVEGDGSRKLDAFVFGQKCCKQHFNICIAVWMMKGTLRWWSFKHEIQKSPLAPKNHLSCCCASRYCSGLKMTKLVVYDRTHGIRWHVIYNNLRLDRHLDVFKVIFVHWNNWSHMVHIIVYLLNQLLFKVYSF